MILPKIAIVGRPNVGKSTLFNSLCQKKLATVDEKPGLTRDRKEHSASLFDIDFMLVDTAGWDDSASEMEKLMIEQTESAIKGADLLLFLVDGKNGLTSLDNSCSDVIRRSKKPFLFLVNKSESHAGVMQNVGDMYSLGFDNPIYISAAHKEGFDDLYFELKKALQNITPMAQEEEDDEPSASIAIVGKPNAGKSTLFNAILKKNRSIVSKQSGTTRDSITSQVKLKEDFNIDVIDTAGLVKRSKEDGKSAFVGQTISAVRRSSVILLMVDIQEGITKQDLLIARMAANEGKGIIIVMNKIDTLSKKELQKAKDELQESLSISIRDLVEPSVVYISALTEENTSKIHDYVKATYDGWQRKLSTPALNKWLSAAISKHEPPLIAKNRRLRFKYITQIASRPPTFQIHCNVDKVSDTYIRYLRQSMSDHFKLVSIPIRFIIKTSENPYAK